MCGVAAYLALRGGAARRTVVEGLCELMAKRGPDDSGVWGERDSPICLGHRRLAVIDVDKRAAQPMVGALGKLVISFNGEIYNYAELKRELERDGVSFRTNSDTEVLLALYERAGIKMLTRLRGMFAFALWDGHRDELVLARDPYGIKPLYYSRWNDEAVIVASSARALASARLATGDRARQQEAHSGARSGVNAIAVARFLATGSVPDETPLGRGINAVGAGHCIVVGRDGKFRSHQYYDVAAVFMAARTSSDTAERRRCTTEALRETTRMHLTSDVPVGLFLSAGIDSGTLLGLMHDVGAPGPLAVTARFSGDDVEDLEGAWGRRTGRRLSRNTANWQRHNT